MLLEVGLSPASFFCGSISSFIVLHLLILLVLILFWYHSGLDLGGTASRFGWIMLLSLGDHLFLIAIVSVDLDTVSFLVGEDELA